ncbi:MAG: aromatic-ring-hydroxylating dioxygenase subunit beta [Acidimicrobiales bacterium]
MTTLRELGTQSATAGWSERAARFLAHEAYLLDERLFEEWIELFCDDGIYWIPIDRKSEDPGETLNIAYEGPPRLRQRVARLRSGIAHAQEPPSSTVHAYSSIYVVDELTTDELAVVRSALIVAESRLGRETFVSARCEHHLRARPSGATNILRKRIDLVGADEAQSDLSFIL